MKINASDHHWQVDELAPVPTGGGMLHLDGQCFEGERGVLAVALRPESFRLIRRTVQPTHWLLPVENPELVREAASLSGDLLWLCSRNPAEVLGKLDDGMRGAWLEPDAVMLNLDGQLRRLQLIQAPSAAFAIPYLARVVANHWRGPAPTAQFVVTVEMSQLQSAIRSAA